MRRPVVLVMALLASAWLAAPARAAWSSTASGRARAGSTTIAVTGTLTTACVSLSAKVTLSWAATTSSWSDGYEVRWGTSPGTYSSSATTTSVTYTTPALPLGTYYFAVRTTKGNWRSASSNEASRTVISVLGVGTCV